MSFTQSKLSLFHSFSKMPAQDSTSLGNAINKSGHTVTASEVWASDIPYYGKMGSLQDAIDKVQPYARKNDLCFITAGTDKNKTYIYDGAGNWTLINGTGKLTQGQLLKNAKDENVILYHENETLTNLNEGNNANTDSANNAARLWTTIGKDGQACASRLVEQFVGPTDKALNGLASVAFSPSIAEGALVAGTDYWDYCFSGTILWEKTRSAATKITCFEYIGAKVSDVVDTVSTQGTTIQSVKDQVDTISDALGLGSEVVGTTLGSRVTDNENALKVLLGLDEGDKVVASESIATTAAKAVSTSLTGTADGTIGKAINDAKQEALDAINAIQHFSVVVVPEGQTMENVTPVENTIYLVSDAQAADGSYIEYIAFKQGETVVTERIGTTKLDLEGYTTDAEHKALADRVEALDAATTGRVAVVEDKVSTLEGQVETITSTDATKTGSIAKALADAKSYTDEAIETELAEGGSIAQKITSAINALGDVAVKSDITITEIKVKSGSTTTTLTPDSNKSVTVEIPEVQAATTDVAGVVTISDNNAIAIDETSTAAATVAAVAATRSAIAAEMGALAGTVSDNKTEVDGKISAIEGQLGATGTTGAAIKTAQETADEALGIAQTAVQSVTRATGSSTLLTVTDGTDVTISLDADVATKTDASTIASTAITTSLEGTADDTIGGAISSAVGALKTELTTGDDSLGGKVTALENSVKTINETTIPNAITSAKTQTLGTTIPTATGKDNETSPKVTVELSGSVGTPSLKVTTDDIASAQELATLKQTVTDKNVATSANAQAVGVTASNNTVDVDVATYTNKTWAKKTNLVTGSAVESAVSDAKSDVLGATIKTATGKDAETSPKVTVELSGTVQTPQLTVTTDDIASAQALQALSDRVTGLHQTPQFSVVVVAGVTDLANWKDAVDGGVKKNTIYLVENTEAADGSYIEFIAYESGETVVTEKIGTTKTDLADYAKTSEVEQAISDAIGALDTSAPVGEGAVKVSQTDGIVSSVTVATEALVDEGAIKASVTDANALVKASDALEAIKLAKPENYVASVTGYTTEGAEVTTTQGAAVKVLDGRGTSVTANDLWGTTTTMDANGVVTVDHKNVTNPNTGWTPWNSSITKVENNKAYVGDTLYGNIQTEAIKSANGMFYGAAIASFNGDLSNLTSGYSMFKECTNLIDFWSDLPSLTDGSDMFAGTKLPSFNDDLPSLTNGSHMFAHCSALTSFNGDLSSLKEGDGMFVGCNKLKSFTSDLSSLTDGSNMFTGCSELKLVDSDLPNLKYGQSMFYHCTILDSFNGDLPSLIKGTYMFAHCSALTSFNGDLSSLTDGYKMFQHCSALTSFNGDLSSLTRGDDMFSDCKLDTESVEIIADTINNVFGTAADSFNTKRIDIWIGNETPNDEEDAAFKQMQTKGWDVFVNGSGTEYVPAEGEATLDETGETTVAPKPYWAKPIEVTEEEAEFVGEDGKFYQVVGGQFIYVTDPDTYGMFVSREDAIANMRLTKYVKPVEEEI